MRVSFALIHTGQCICHPRLSRFHQSIKRSQALLNPFSRWAYLPSFCRLHATTAPSLYPSSPNSYTQTSLDGTHKAQLIWGQPKWPAKKEHEISKQYIATTCLLSDIFLCHSAAFAISRTNCLRISLILEKTSAMSVKGLAYLAQATGLIRQPY